VEIITGGIVEDIFSSTLLGYTNDKPNQETDVVYSDIKRKAAADCEGQMHTVA